MKSCTPPCLSLIHIKGGKAIDSSALRFCWGGSQTRFATVVLALSFLSFNQQVQAFPKPTETIGTPTGLSTPQRIQTETTPVLPVVHPQEAIEQPRPVLLPKGQLPLNPKEGSLTSTLVPEVIYSLETE